MSYLSRQISKKTYVAVHLESKKTGEMILKIGYARVSSIGQSLAIQNEHLERAGCEKIFSEKQSATSISSRMALADAIEFARVGDILITTRLDRLARSITDLRKIIDQLSAKKVEFRCLQQCSIDTSRSDGKLLLNILGSFAEFEADIRRERQLEGIAKAKERGVYKGRKNSISSERVFELKQSGMGASKIANEMQIARASVYRILEKIEKETTT